MKKYGKIIIIVVGIIAIIALLILIYFKTTFISKDDVKDIIAANMNANVNDLYFEDIDFDFDKGVYEVEVYYHNDAYEYKVDARTSTEGGSIIYTDFKYFTNGITDDNSSNNNNNNSNNSSTNGSTNNATTASIPLDEAKNIALTHANLTEDTVSLLRTEQEYENGVLVYEIDFTHGDFEYDYKINANTGEVVSYDRDSIYD